MSARPEVDVTSPDEVDGLELAPPVDDRDKNFPAPASASVSLQSSMSESRLDWGRDSLP